MKNLTDDAVFKADATVGATMAALQGCADRFCYLTGHRDGVVTNGGCQCVKDYRVRALLIAFHRLRKALHDQDVTE